jgi:ABC-type glycerol-3-phosphate transport system substrate-binding protein
MKIFQTGILIFFGVFLFVAVLIFSGAIKLPQKATTATSGINSVVIWGTVPSSKLSTSIGFLNNKNAIRISYVEKDPTTYEADLLNAFAFGGLPDIFLLSQDLIIKYKDKIITIPYTNFPERTFDDTYIRQASIFKTPVGFLGFPLLSDPLVMYYNQDLLETAGYTTAPKYWSDLFDYVPKLTKKNQALQITTSGVALGQFSNIKNAKKIFSALMLQLDNAITVFNFNTNRYDSILSQASTVSKKPAVQSLNFFNEFSDPLNDVYSWNKTKKEAQDAFISGDLAIYFGLASEFDNITKKNPNLNFDVATLPQVKEINNKITYGDIYALAIPQSSPNAQAALSIIADLANGTDTYNLVAPTGFAPVRRDLIAQTNISKYSRIFYDSALNARSWVDPDNQKTNVIFTKMEESVLSGLSTPEQSIKDTETQIQSVL